MVRDMYYYLKRGPTKYIQILQKYLNIGRIKNLFQVKGKVFLFYLDK